MVKVCLSCGKRTEMDDDGEGDNLESHGFCSSKDGFPCKDIYLQWNREKSKKPLPEYFQEVMGCALSGATPV